MKKKEYFETIVESSVRTDKAIRKDGAEDIDGEKGYAFDIDIFSELTEELRLHDGDATDEDLIQLVYFMEANAGKFYDEEEHDEPVKVVDVDGERKLFLVDGVFEDSYGENSVERALSAVAASLNRVPFSKWIKETVEDLGLDVRDEYLENVDEEVFERFYESVVAPKVGEEELPACLLGEGVTVLEISMQGCAPCKVVRSAFEELKDKMDGVDFVVKDMRDKEISGFVETFGIFAAPTILFSDGKRLLVHVGGNENISSQVQFLKRVIDGIGEFQYDPRRDRGVLQLGEEKLVLMMKVIE